MTEDLKSMKMKTAFFCDEREENIPISKYPEMINFAKHLGSGAAAQLTIGGNAAYTCRSSGIEFQQVLAEDIHENKVQDIGEVDFFSLMNR